MLILYCINNCCFSCEVAKNIPADSYALVFGINTFMSLLLQTCLTIVVNSPIGLMLTIRTQVKLLLKCINFSIKLIINALYWFFSKLGLTIFSLVI